METIQAFFERFEQLSARSDAEGLGRLYAPSFLAAGASGAQVVKAADLVQAIPKRKEVLESAGCRSTTLASLDETKLDESYSMVRTEWRWRFEKSGNPPVEITLPSSVILRRSEEGLRIVFYLNHQDILTVLRQRGLLPASTV